jgi:hypothetical protein
MSERISQNFLLLIHKKSKDMTSQVFIEHLQIKHYKTSIMIEKL